MYSKIPLIRLTWDQAGAELLNVPDHQTVPLLTSSYRYQIPYRPTNELNYITFRVIKNTLKM